MEKHKVKELVIPFGKYAGGISVRLLVRILNLWRLGISCLFTVGLSLILLSIGFKNEAVAPLLILSALISVIFLYLFFYVLHIRPEIMENIRKHEGKNGKGVFRASDFTISFEEEKPHTLSYKSIKGQYWFDEYYFLFIDSSNYRTVIAFSINETTFDSIYMLADSLSKRKVRLVQIKKKERRDKNEAVYSGANE